MYQSVKSPSCNRLQPGSRASRWCLSSVRHKGFGQGTHLGIAKRCTYCTAVSEPGTAEIMADEADPLRKINPFVASMKPSGTGFISDLAKTLKAEGRDIISLAVGEPDFDTPQPVIDAGMEALRMGKTRYTKAVGTDELRAAISRKLKADNDLDYDPSCIIVSTGAKQAVWEAVMATCGPGDEVMIPAPYWVSYPEMARFTGATPKIIETDLDAGYILKPEELEAALTPASRLLMLCSPANPSGIVYSKKELEALAEVIKSHPRLVVLSDEIYEYILYPPAQHYSMAKVPGMFERTITVNGFSKSFAMTGWRLGYSAAPQYFSKAMAMVQSHSTTGANSISQHAGLAALGMGPRGGPHVKKMVDAFYARRNLVVERLSAMPGVRVLPPQGAFYALFDVSELSGVGAHVGGYGPVSNGDEVCQYILEKAEVALVPGSAFGAPSSIRMSFAESLETLEKALDRIALALSEIKR